jgi:uncharacterized protein YgiM (DUF1202 family)
VAYERLFYEKRLAAWNVWCPLLTTDLSIRSEPNTKSKILITLKKGTKVEYLGKSGNWLNIKLSTGVTGWVFNSLVTEGK